MTLLRLFELFFVTYQLIRFLSTKIFFTFCLLALSGRFTHNIWKKSSRQESTPMLQFLTSINHHKNNVFFLNKMLFLFGKSNPSLSPFSKLHDETVAHIHYECNITQSSYIEQHLTLIQLSPRTTFFGFINLNLNTASLQNFICYCFFHFLFVCFVFIIITIIIFCFSYYYYF